MRKVVQDLCADEPRTFADQCARSTSREIAQQDIADIVAADVVVVFNPVESWAVGRGGRHVETGCALAYGKQVVVVGTRGNVFHWLPQVTVLADWAALTPYLETEFAAK